MAHPSKVKGNKFERDADYEYPDCYDAMYLELNNRGVDTDFELDSIYGEL